MLRASGKMDQPNHATIDALNTLDKLSPSEIDQLFDRVFYASSDEEYSAEDRELVDKMIRQFDDEDKRMSLTLCLARGGLGLIDEAIRTVQRRSTVDHEGSSKDESSGEER